MSKYKAHETKTMTIDEAAHLFKKVTSGVPHAQGTSKGNVMVELTRDPDTGFVSHFRISEAEI